MARVFSRGYGLSGYGLAKQAILLFFFIILLAGHAAAEPQATLKHHPRSVSLNRLLHMTLEVMWTGEADVYDIPQPDLSGLTEFEIIGQGLSAMREGGNNRLKYEFVAKPLKQGEYDLAGIKIKYFEKGKDIPIAIPLPRTVVRVGPKELLSGRARIVIGLAVAMMAGVIGMSIVIRNRKKSRESELDEANAAGHRRADLLAELNAIRSLRIEGATGEYLEKLSELAASDVLQRHIEKADDLRQLAEDVKFGGQASSPDQLNWAENLVKRAIRKAFPADESDKEGD